MRLREIIAVAAIVFALVAGGPATAGEKVRVSVLNIGTVNRGIPTIQCHDLEERNSVSLDILPLASGQAATRLECRGGNRAWTPSASR